MTAKLPTARTERAAAAVVVVGDSPLTLDQLGALASGAARPAVSAPALTRMAQSHLVTREQLAEGRELYGITTGVGASVEQRVAAEDAAELSLNLLRFHGCGTGRILDPDESAAVLAVRLSSLTRGLSGVRPVVAEHLAKLLTHRVLPCIPAEGSVGASGDLTPLSYVAAVLAGEREVMVDGEVMSAAAGLERAGLKPLAFDPKEALALMNGTSVATAIGCLAWTRARRLARVASRITAMASSAIHGNPEHFDAFIHDAKPHPGQVLAARWIRDDLGPPTSASPQRLQDRYSIRCAPHVIGVLIDALTWSQRILETELSGVSDNPIVDVARRRVLHGGNFYGGHVGFALDSLKVAVANVADLLDRQLLLLGNPRESDGLPADLVGVTGQAASVHHGFKAMSIAASALTAEALKLTMPASAFSRSTELHNQDKVPMATIAARDTLRIVQLTEQVAAIALLMTAQAHELRQSATGDATQSPACIELLERVRRRVPAVTTDRRMDRDIAKVLELLHADALVDVAETSVEAT